MRPVTIKLAAVPVEISIVYVEFEYDATMEEED